MNLSKKAIMVLTSVVLIISSCSRSQKILYTSNTENAKKFGLGTSPLQPITNKPLAQVEETNTNTATLQEEARVLAENNSSSIITIPNVKKFSGTSSLYSRKKQVINDNNDDVILLKNGEQVKCKLVEVGAKKIKYKRCDNLEGADIVISKNNIQALIGK